MTDLDDGRLAELDYQTWVRSFAIDTRVEIVDGPELLIRRSDVRHDYLSSVFGAWLEPAAATDRIEAVIGDLGREGRPFIWSVWPSDTPDDLPDRLVRAGLDDDGEGPLMACSLAEVSALDEAPPAGLDVRDVRSPDEIAEVVTFALGPVGDEGVGDEVEGLEVFGAVIRRLAAEAEPRLRLFGGWLDGRLVTSSGLHTGTGVAGIYAVHTAEASRGKGYGRALTLAAMRAGRDLGARTAVLLASELGEPVYRRIGFREVGSVRFLRWPGVTAT